MDKLKQLDFLGIILNVGAFTALIMAINFGGNLYDWGDGRQITLWVVGGALLLLFGVQQKFGIGTNKVWRIFPADFLRMPIMWILFALMNAAATCVFVSHPCALFIYCISVSMICTNKGVGAHFLYSPLLPVRA